jgi:tetratricopeptide (TPR) repeat protein
MRLGEHHRFFGHGERSRTMRMLTFVIAAVIASLLEPASGARLTGEATVPGDSREAGVEAVQRALRAVIDSSVVAMTGAKIKSRFVRELEASVHAKRSGYIRHYSIPFVKDDPFDGQTHRKVVADVDLDAVADTLMAMGLVWRNTSGEVAPCSEVVVNFRGFSPIDVARLIAQLSDSGYIAKDLGAVHAEMGVQNTFLVSGDAWELARALGKASGGTYRVGAVAGNVIDVEAGGDASVRPSEEREDLPPLEVLEFWIDHVFPARYHLYQTHPVGRITVVNHTTQTIGRLQIELSCPQFLDIDWIITEGHLLSGEQKEIDLVIPFARSKLMKNRSETTAFAKVSLTCWVKGGEATYSAATSFTVHSRNSLDWADTRAAVAFVTPNAEGIQRFARGAASTSVDGADQLPGRLGLSFKVAQSIRNREIRYVPDPPPVGPARYDYVQLPGETLALRAGDCEDTSVLLASCLENTDIPVRLLLTSDHVFTAFGTNVPAKDGFMVSPDRQNYLVFDGMVWLPVETTLLSEGFLTAWDEGVQTYREIERTGDYLEEVDIREAWADYPPVAAEQAVDIGAANLAGAAEELYEWRARRERRVRELEIELRTAVEARNDDTFSTYRLGLLLGREGRIEEALPLLSRIRNEADVGPLARVSEGNCHLLTSRVDSAVACYNRALQIDPEEVSAWLNLGVAYQLSGDKAGAVEAFGRTLDLASGNDAALAKMLGVALQETTTKAAEAESRRALSKAELRDLLAEARAAHAGKAIVDRGPSRHKFAGRKALDPEQKHTAERLIYWPEPTS